MMELVEFEAWLDETMVSMVAEHRDRIEFAPILRGELCAAFRRGGLDEVAAYMVDMEARITAARVRALDFHDATAAARTAWRYAGLAAGYRVLIGALDELTRGVR